MDLYLTFYNFPPEGDFLSIKNAFSFGREKKPEDIDLFFNIDAFDVIMQIQQSINKYKPNRVWASFTFREEFSKISIIIDKRWIIGGNFIAINKGNEEFYSRFRKNNLPIFVYGTMESFLGKEISSDFDPYFLDFINLKFSNKKIMYSLSLGNSCYWKECSFCMYKNFENLGAETFERPNIEKIIPSAIPFKYGTNNFKCWSSISSTPPQMIKKIINSNKNNAHIIMYLRADDECLNQIKQFDDLSCYTFAIGLEGLSQKVIDKLNKGFKLTTALELIEEIINKNGSVVIFLMTNYIFLTNEIVNECRKTVNELKRINSKTINKLNSILLQVSIIIWNDIKLTEDKNIKAIEFKSCDLIKRYQSVIPECDEQYELNNKIIDLIETIPCRINMETIK
jgi:hypothetical protein